MTEGDEMQQEIAGLQAQIASVQVDLGARLERIEKALLGDDEAGLTGMVKRVNRLDEADRRATDAHLEMEKNRREGDQRLHQRIDEVDLRIGEVDKKNDTRWTRFVYMAIGMSVGSAGGAAWFTHLLTGGG